MTNYFLHLNGVFLHDVPEVQSHESIKISDFIRHDKIPTVFTSIDTWKRQTNLKCWNCCRKFDSMPIPVVNNIITLEDGSISMSTIGNFCSFACARRYITDTYPNDLANRFFINLKFLYKKMTGKKIDTFPLAPNRTQLVKFGGTISLQELLEIIHSSYVQIGDTPIDQLEIFDSEMLNKITEDTPDFIFNQDEKIF